MNVGVSHDAPTFALASIRRGWNEIGRAQYPQANRLLIVADCGGSNSSHSLVFTILLHQFALETGLAVTIGHLPPGTSTWNTVEHRLFAQISSNWRGRPLTSIDVVIASIAATTTGTGLSVWCVLDESDYPTGVTGSWDTVDTLPITFHDFRPAWNYTIAPTPADPEHAPSRAKNRRAAGQPGRHQPTPVTLLGDTVERATWIARLVVPEITGIPAVAWDELATRLEPAYRQLREQQAAAARGGRPSAYPDRRDRGLKIPITQLMLATVLHERHLLPAAQASRLIDINTVSMSQHIAKLAPLFAECGHPITPTDRKIKKIEQLYASPALPQGDPATHEVTT